LPPVTAPPHFRGPFRADDTARALYSEGAGIYRVLPAAVAVPRDVDDLVALVRWARETRTPLVPRGAGSGMAGGNVGPGVVVDLTQGFAEPPTIDAAARTARAGAAVIYRTLCDAAAVHGLVLPPDPASGKFCTLGGMVGTNAAGPHTLKHGAMRRWIRALEFVTADAQVGRAEVQRAADDASGLGAPRDGRAPCVPSDRPSAPRPGHEHTAAVTEAERRFLRDVAPEIRRQEPALTAAVPHTPKNSSGYDLPGFARTGDITNLLVGSEGTLALVTAVEVALAPLAEHRTTLLVALRALEDVGPAVLALLPLQPAALELMDRTYLDFVQASTHRPLPAGTEAALLVEFEGDGDGAAEAVRSLAAQTERAGDPVAVEKLWELRHLASPILARMPDETRSLQLVEDGCVPVQRLGEYIAALRETARRHGFRIVVFGHAGDGHLHANVIADLRAPDLVQRLAACLDEVTAAQIALGGTPSGEHGDGRLRAPYLEQVFGATYAGLCRSVKEAWDPAGILNPGVVVAAPGARPLDLPLKVGLAAPSIPVGIAGELRRIERDAAWGTYLLGADSR
jgi:FAD/FMN-containing dehydrogenase